mgnify:CR=1 FL=1
METKKSKLHLRKEVVARLNTTEMNRLQGGVDYDSNKGICPTEKADNCYVNSDFCGSAICQPSYPHTQCQCDGTTTKPICPTHSCVQYTDIVCQPVEPARTLRKTCLDPLPESELCKSDYCGVIV